jgi:hypothetical protein
MNQRPTESDQVRPSQTFETMNPRHNMKQIRVHPWLKSAIPCPPPLVVSVSSCSKHPTDLGSGAVRVFGFSWLKIIAPII